MSVQRVYLVISADKRVRAAKRPQVRDDEVAIAIDLTFPDGWGRVVQRLSIDVPDFAPTAEFVEEEIGDEPAESGGSLDTPGDADG